MHVPNPRSLQDPQAGGVTILVVLMLLVMFTVTIFGVSRNALRQSIISGTARQGAEVRNVADAGIYWSVFWLDDNNTAPSGMSGATAFQTTLGTLLKSPNLAGIYQPIAASSNSDMSIQNATGDVQTFDMNLMRMGKLPVLFTSQNVIATNTPSEVLYPDLWAVRANANYVQGPIDFIHSKEAFVSTKARSVTQ